MEFPKLNYTHLEHFLVQNLQFFLVKYVWLLNVVRTYYVKKLDEEDRKKIQLEKSQIFFFSSCPTFVFDE